MGGIDHFKYSLLKRSESFIGGESELRAFEDSRSSRVMTQSIIKSGGGGLLSGPLTKNFHYSRLHSKHRVLYLETIMEEGG